MITEKTGASRIWVAIAWWLKDAHGLKILELILIATATIAGVNAVLVYRDQARIAVTGSLDTLDGALRKEAVDKPYINSFYAHVRGNLSAKEEADVYIAMLIECREGESPEECGKVNRTFPNWSSIPELDCSIWQNVGFHGWAKTRLREAVNHAESMLYLVARAFEHKDTLGDSEYSTWARYVVNNGHHPLFLTALHYGRRHGYLSNEAATEMLKLVRQGERGERALRELYKEHSVVHTGAMAGLVGCPP